MGKFVILWLNFIYSIWYPTYIYTYIYGNLDQNQSSAPMVICIFNYIHNGIN